MKKIYLSLFVLNIATISFSQMVQSKVVTSGLKYSNTQRSASPTSSVTTSKDKEQNEVIKPKVLHFSETFDNDITANGWVISSGPASTTTDPLQNWHVLTTGGNPDGRVNIDYINSEDYHDEFLTSPMINIPNAGIELRFDFLTSYYWHVSPNDNVDIKVEISTDGGVSFNNLVWQEDDDALLEASGTLNWETFTWTTARLNMNAYVGQNIMIRFHYDGIDGAQASIDNVIVEDLPGNDIQITKAYTHDIINAYDYSIEASSQVQAMVVGAILRNGGMTSVTAHPLSLTINDGTTNVYTNTINVDLPSGSSDTIWVETGFIPDANKTFTISFSIPADDNTSNDALAVSFQTSTTLYAHDFPSTGSVNFNEDGEYSYGNIFEINNTTTLPAAAVRFATGTTATQVIVRVSRFDYEHATFNGVQSMEFIGEVDYNIPSTAIGSANYTNINFTTPITLEAGWYYVVEVRKLAGTERLAVFASDEGNADFSTVVFAPLTDGTTNYTSGGLSWSPAVRMSFVSTVSVQENESLSSFNVYPNPASNDVEISYALKNNSTVNVSITDLSGKVVYSSNLGNKAEGTHSLSLNTSSFSNGVYVVNFATDNAVVTEKLVIRK
jgi:flagellar hook assembly protein FlgD